MKGAELKTTIVEESIKFCFGYVEHMEYIGTMRRRNKVWDDEEGDVGHNGNALSSGIFIELDETSLIQAHRWVLHKLE